MTNKEALEFKDEQVKITALVGFVTAAITSHIIFPDKSIFEITADYLAMEAVYANVIGGEKNELDQR